jgi:hypothetical protein
MVSHCACPLTVTRDVQDWRDEREAGMVYLVYLVGRIGNSSKRTRQTRKTSQPDRQTRARCTSTGDHLVCPLMFPQVLNPMRRDLVAGGSISCRMASNKERMWVSCDSTLLSNSVSFCASSLWAPSTSRTFTNARTT